MRGSRTAGEPQPRGALLVEVSARRRRAQHVEAAFFWGLTVGLTGFGLVCLLIALAPGAGR